jgi:acetolactate synthase regulatory subunit
MRIDVSADVCNTLINRILRIAEQRGWEATFEQAAEEIYLLRRDRDAVQVHATDSTIHIDSSAAQRGEFDAIVADARRSLIADLSA